MNNQELVDTFNLIADLLAIKGENIFVVQAYRNLADNLYELSVDINDLFRQGRLDEIQSAGKAMRAKIAELLTTEKLQFLEHLQKEVPPSLAEILQVRDVGPKRVALFWKELGVLTVQDLEIAVQDGRLSKLPGMGEKTIQRIRAGIEAYKRRSKRILLSTAWTIAFRWLDYLRQQPGVQRVEVGGSLRRWKATIGDIDLVAATTNPQALAQAAGSHPDVVNILGSGEHKVSLEIKNGLNLQLWMQPPERFGTLWQYVTGSKEHNIALRELAQKKGFSLSERAITTPESREILFSDEEVLYRFLDLEFIPPELRQNRDEIHLAQAHQLPALIQPEDLKADLHCHSTWSDGANTIEEMAQAAIDRGLKVLAITDHSGGLGIAYGLTSEKLRAQGEEIRRLQAKLGDRLTLLHGSEVEIHADGTLDFPDEVLAELDIVIASLHTSLTQPSEAITNRLLGVMRNPHVDVIAHCSGRLLPNREGASLDMVAVLATAGTYGVAFEINANPARLDLDEVHVRTAISLDIPLLINTDAHSVSQLAYARFGVAAARRAGATASNILSAWQPDDLLSWLRARQ